MMNVGIKAEVLTLAVVAEMQSPVIVVSTLQRYTPVINETFIPTNVISIAGHSISAINPEFYEVNKQAVYAIA